MKRAVIMAMIASTLLAGLANSTAQASGPAAKTEAGANGPTTTRTMDAPYLAAPVVREGHLVNYLFISVRVEISSSVDLWRTREKAHFLRDALVRASHANDLSSAEDDNLVDEARAIEVYRAAAASVLGANAVSGVSIVAAYSSRGSGV
jgi:hypothetical protein